MVTQMMSTQLARPDPPEGHSARPETRTATSTASSPASRSSAASASRSATRCAACCSRRSRARRSPRSASTARSTSSRRFRDVVEDVTDIILNLKEVVFKASRREDVHGPPRERGPRPGATRGDIQLVDGLTGPEPRPPHRDARQEGPAVDGAHGQRGPRLRAGRAQQDADDADRHDPDRRAVLADPQGELHRAERARRSGHRLRQAHARGLDQRRGAPGRRRRLRRQDPEGAALDLDQLRGDRRDELPARPAATTSRSTRTCSARSTSSSSPCARRTACRTRTSR